MRIVFDAFWWAVGPPSLRHVLRETVFEWQRQFPDDDIIVVVRRQTADLARKELGPSATVTTTTLWPQALAASLASAMVARRCRADVVFTHNFASVSSSMTVVFLHDILFRTNPEWFSVKERVYFGLMPLLVRRANLVLTSSVTEADRIRSNSRARLVVPVGLGVSGELVSSPAVIGVAGLEPGKFLLTVGRLNVRKNLGNTILGALQSGALRTDFPLVVVGGANGKGETLPAEIGSALAAGLVVFTGHVSDAELRWLYQHTRLFLFLTRGEGFGLPAVEAGNFGARMILSDIPVFREIVGGNVRMVAPEDTNAIAKAIIAELSTDPVSFPTGENWSSKYTWPRVVAAMRDAILKISDLDRSA